MDALIPYLPYVAMLVLVVLVLARQIALGHGQALAQDALAFLLNQMQTTIDSVTRDDVDLAVGCLYDAAPAAIGRIPWKLLVSKQMCQDLAWEAWDRLHKLAHNADGAAIIRAVETQRRARA